MTGVPRTPIGREDRRRWNGSDSIRLATPSETNFDSGAAPRGRVGVTVVISGPDLGVSAVAAAGVLCAFPAWWTHYLHSVSAAGPVQDLLSLLFLELNGYYVDAVRLHVHAADVLVRCGVDRKASDNGRFPCTVKPGGCCRGGVGGGAHRVPDRGGGGMRLCY
jgi:hypothetical protein